MTCGTHEHCEPANKQCVCDPGFVSSGGKCEPTLPGDPTNHTEKQVCDAWKKGHVMSDSNPWKGGADTCDPGTLSQGGINDTLARINMFRWMLGLGPVSDSDTQNEYDMYCAAVASWNPPGVVPNPHSPPTTAKCYTAKGASGAGSSNIAWGSGHPANAIDQYIRDNGNYSTFGHRRWIFNAPLGPVGIGYYAGGGPYGNAQCLGVFASTAGGPYPEWISFPPPGFSPVSIVKWVWTFHHKKGVSGATMTVTRKSDSADLAMKRMPLAGGYGPSYQVVAFQIQSWTPKAGETYLVHVEGVGSSPIDYEVKPTDCQ